MGKALWPRKPGVQLAASGTTGQACAPVLLLPLPFGLPPTCAARRRRPAGRGRRRRRAAGTCFPSAQGAAGSLHASRGRAQLAVRQVTRRHSAHRAEPRQSEGQGGGRRGCAMTGHGVGACSGPEVRVSLHPMCAPGLPPPAHSTRTGIATHPSPWGAGSPCRHQTSRAASQTCARRRSSWRAAPRPPPPAEPARRPAQQRRQVGAQQAGGRAGGRAGASTRAARQRPQARWPAPALPRRPHLPRQRLQAGPEGAQGPDVRVQHVALVHVHVHQPAATPGGRLGSGEGACSQLQPRRPAAAPTRPPPQPRPAQLRSRRTLQLGGAPRRARLGARARPGPPAHHTWPFHEGSSCRCAMAAAYSRANMRR